MNVAKRLELRVRADIPHHGRLESLEFSQPHVIFLAYGTIAAIEANA